MTFQESVSTSLADLLLENGLDKARWTSMLKEKLNINQPIQLQFLEEKDMSSCIAENAIGWEKQALWDLIRKVKIRYGSVSEAESCTKSAGLLDGVTDLQDSVKLETRSAIRADLERELQNKLESPKYNCRDSNVTTDVFDKYIPISTGPSVPAETPATLSPHKLLSNVSAGKALCGIYVTEGMPSESANTDQVIKCPENIELLEPSMPVTQDIVEKTSEKELKTFNASIETIGISLALKGLCSEAWPREFQSGEISGEISTGTEKKTVKLETHEKRSISITKYCVFPTHAIRLKQETMELEDNVLRDLQTLEGSIMSKTPSAENLQFINKNVSNIFKRYGTHVNRGLLHLGGIYSQNNSYKCDSSTKDEKTENMVLWSLQADLTTGFQLGASSGNMKFESTHGDLNNEYDKKQLSKIKVCVRKHGGSSTANDFDEWRNSLWTNPAIIDYGKDFERSFCGIWDLVQNHHTCFKFPKGLSLFLKYAWCSLISNSKFEVDSEEHLEQFIRMVLVNKSQGIDDYIKFLDPQPIPTLLQLCKIVIGDNKALYLKIAAIIHKENSAIGMCFNMLHR